MLNIKQKIESIKNRFKLKIEKVKYKINNTTRDINKIKISSLMWYWAVIFVWGLLVWVNMSNFVLCLSDKYPELTISINREVASLKQANDVIKQNSDNLKLDVAVDVDDIIYSSEIISKKIEYKKILLERAGNTIYNIPTEKRKKFINQINDVLLKINSLESDETNKVNNFLYKLLALKEILDKSLVWVADKEEEIIFNSAEEKEDNNDNWDKKPEEKEIPKLEIKEEVVVPVIKEIPKPEIKEEVVVPVIKEIPKPEIKEEVVVPIVKEVPKPKIKEQVVVPAAKETPKVEEKKVDVPVVKPVVTNNYDSISLSLNKQIASQLQRLNAPIFDWFKIKVLKNNNLVLEKWIRYTYVYSQYKNFWKWVIPSEADLSRSGLNKNTTVLLLDNAWASFAVDYKKVKLISDNIISNIANKQEFLRQLIDDKRYLHNDTDELFKSLKNTTQNLTSGSSRATKISKIYAYILRNISYSTNFSISNKNIFSWILTYKNKVWICWGYTKLNLYMLSFAWVSDARVVKWYVIDAPDFPSIWHSWVQIGYQYYDPTFDDPVWASKTKSAYEYKYFGLPRDLFYTNRFNYWTLPGHLKTASLSSRKDLIKENIAKLANKYKDRNYILIKPFSFRTANNLTSTEKITIEKIKKIIPSYEVNWFKFTQDGITKTIANIDYYTVDDNNLEPLLEQLNYNIDWYKLFKWDDWSYRLAYNTNIN